MENPKRLTPLHGRAALLAAAACLIVPVHGGEPLRAPSLADRELSKRYESIDEARELLRKGDEAYLDGRYSVAVDAYAGARDLTPEAPATAEFRTFVTDRYAQASVEYARELVRKGDLAGAKSAVDKVLAPAVAPQDPAALQFRAELDDPIRTNPALTAEHARDVDAVRRLLYTADGAYQLGDFDKAKVQYEEVLRIDPTNAASRRGLEKTAAAKKSYYETAYDHTRAELLGEVENAWQLKVHADPIVPTIAGPGDLSDENVFIPVSLKLDRIIFPSINMDQTTLQEAVDFLRVRSAEFDTTELDPARRGVNFTLNLGDPGSPEFTDLSSRLFDIRLRNVPLSGILKYITGLTRTTYSADDFAITIRPLSAGSEVMTTRTYAVPPNFLSSISTNTSAREEPTDPFSQAPSGSLLPKQRTVEEIFTANGISFPPGASASLIRSSNTLRVVNTLANHETISQLVESVKLEEPTLCKVSVTMIHTEQDNLKELGFDWALGTVGIGANANGGADASTLNLTGGTQGNGGDLSDLATIAGVPLNPITAGNRSGDAATLANSLDAVIDGGNIRPGQGGSRAPGVFSVFGTLGDTAVNMLMRGLDQKKNVDLMSQPSVITRSAQSAKVEVIREFIYPTEYEPPELPNTITGTDNYDEGVLVGSEGPDFVPVTPSHPTAFSTRNVGVTLEVLPTASADKRFIDLTIHSEVVEFDGFVNYGSPINTITPAGLLTSALSPRTLELTDNSILMPVFTPKRITTSLTFADGATIVIGGLLKESIRTVDDHTPILGNIPVAGRLFQSKVSQPVSTAIVFLVHVELIDPTGRPFRDR